MDSEIFLPQKFLNIRYIIMYNSLMWPTIINSSLAAHVRDKDYSNYQHSYYVVRYVKTFRMLHLTFEGLFESSTFVCELV